MSNEHAVSIPRRVVLSSAVVAGGPLLLRPRCLWTAGASGLPALSFIVVSDTHLGYHDQPRAAQRWEATAKEIDEAAGELVLHLGDVVDGGRESQYPVYLAARKLIRKPIHEIPGNHDPEKLFAKYVRRQIDTVVELKWLRFLLLNNSRTTSHDGFLSDEQLEWIDGQCRDARKQNQFIALCMHVPAHTNQHPDRGWYVKPESGQTRLYDIVTTHQNRVLALMHGHFHNGLRGWDDHAPVHEICFPSALYNLDRRLEAQHAPGYNPPEFRPGYTLVTIQRGEMRLAYKPVGAPVAVRHACRLRSIARSTVAR